MENKINPNRERLLISFSGCTKKDKIDKKDGSVRGVTGIRRTDSNLSKHIPMDAPSMNSYKF